MTKNFLLGEILNRGEAMTLLLTNKDVEQATDIKTQIHAIEKGLLEEAYGTVDLPPRLNLATTTGFFRVMPTVMRDSGLMGYKVFHGLCSTRSALSHRRVRRKRRRSPVPHGCRLSDCRPDRRDYRDCHQVYGTT